MGASQLRWAAAVVGVYAIVAGASVVAPQALLHAAAKEGAMEQTSHVVLIVAIAAWATRARVQPRWPAIAIAVVLAIVLGEELDWRVVDGASGANLHAAWSGEAYVLFAAPWIAWYALPFAPARWRERVGPHAPQRDESVAFAIVACVSLASSLAPLAWERALDEVDEAILYMLVLASGLRSRASGATP